MLSFLFHLTFIPSHFLFHSLIQFTKFPQFLYGFFLSLFLWLVCCCLFSVLLVYVWRKCYLVKCCYTYVTLNFEVAHVMLTGIKFLLRSMNCPHSLGTLKQWNTTEVLGLSVVITNLRITLTSALPSVGPLWPSSLETDLHKFSAVRFGLEATLSRVRDIPFLILPVVETSKKGYFCPWAVNVCL